MAQRWVAAVLRHETNTFSPVPTSLKDFGRVGPTDGPAVGDDTFRFYRDTNNPVAAYIDLAEASEVELDFPFAGNAHPSAPAPDEIIDQCSAEVIASIEKGCDALFLDLHGAMVTQGFDDGEGELLRRFREVAPELPIAVALDYHTNLSAAIVENATVICGYRTYPHIDMYETGLRAGRTLLRALSGEVRPVMAWHSLPILTHMNRHAPSMQPMQAVMERAMMAEAEGVILNASLFGCFPLSDIPHVGLSGIVVADGDRDLAERYLFDLMRELWEKREEFVFEVEPIEKSVAEAKAVVAGDGPVILIDHGDNCGSGGNQDVMDVLTEIIAQELDNVCAGPFCDPEAVAHLIDAGVGAKITVQLGGKVDMPAMSLKGQAVEVTGTVRCISDGSFTVTGPMFTGVQMNIGRTVVLDTGRIELVISEGRFEPFDQGCFTHVGIDPAKKDFVLLKSRQHFRAGFEPIAREIVMVSGPGTCTSDYSLFPWKRVRRPLFPLDPEAKSNLPSQS
ncbi:MAG: hypothetical protein CFH10_01336 [Alphaproteobacteria bacterium MarineAlpha4_Bin2]|nr:MAG: hypothetical protein CFH10_01336 [Alphaproteobacteria bacterium MarineAlpha4_Bin2]